MSKKKYLYTGLSVLAVLLLFLGYLGLRRPEPSRFVASLQNDVNDGCENRIEVYPGYIRSSPCQLAKNIEEHTAAYPLHNIQITHFKRKRFNLNLEDYIDNVQKGKVHFSSEYQGEEIVVKCDAKLQVFRQNMNTALSTFDPYMDSVILDFQDCNNKNLKSFDLSFFFQPKKLSLDPVEN
ncbi:MAG: hypothetical protein OXB84_07935 [Halobacteriovoraceae bacterium]|nr:hypothetical protein [Halobacteriovoraceae bacterium]